MHLLTLLLLLGPPAQTRTQAGAWLCTPGAALPPRCCFRGVSWQTTVASAQLLLVGFPSFLVAVWFLSGSERVLSAEGAIASLWKRLTFFCAKSFLIFSQACSWVDIKSHSLDVASSVICRSKAIWSQSSFIPDQSQISLTWEQKRLFSITWVKDFPHLVIDLLMICYFSVIFWGLMLLFDVCFNLPVKTITLKSHKPNPRTASMTFALLR